MTLWRSTVWRQPALDKKRRIVARSESYFNLFLIAREDGTRGRIGDVLPDKIVDGESLLKP